MTDELEEFWNQTPLEQLNGSDQINMLDLLLPGPGNEIPETNPDYHFPELNQIDEPQSAIVPFVVTETNTIAIRPRTVSELSMGSFSPRTPD